MSRLRRGVAGELGCKCVSVACTGDRGIEEVRKIRFFLLGDGQPVNAFLYARIRTARAERGKFGGTDEVADDGSGFHAARQCRSD